MKKILEMSSLLVVAAIAWLPLVNFLLGSPAGWLNTGVVIAMNLLGWSAVIHFLLARKDLKRNIGKVAHDLGIDTRFQSLEALFNSMVREVQRKNSSLSINLIERKITSTEELARTLERIVALAFKLLSAESSELALFDSESSLFHSSFVLGKPFRSSAQAMLSGVMDGEEIDPSPDVLVQPIAFAGSVLGSLRVALKKGLIPSTGDQEIMRILALQSGLAIINAEYTKELVRMKRASEETVKAKTGFLANLSHEIRGPLGIMLNAVELVLDGLCGQVTDDQLSTLKMVRNNGEHLLELINDVLDYAKVESGKVTPNIETVLLNDLLRDITGVVRTQAEKKHHRLVCHEGDEVLAVGCDRRHIRQMLINMLTNSIKYTPDGGTIEVWAERMPGSRIRISVRDTGVGIEESDRYKVFAPFERVENNYSLSQVGSGLGMTLTKLLAEVNGGQIDFESVPGKGSHFWLVFAAVQYDRAEVAAAEQRNEEEAKGAGEMILLVESDENERSMFGRYLRHIGFKVITATSQIEAMDILRKGNVELAMLDNKIVDKPDEFLVKNIRETARAFLLPVILMSSRAFAFDIEKYLKSGIDLCLIKPVALKKLGWVCRKLIDGDYTGDVIDKEALDLNLAKKKAPKPLASRKMLVPDDVVH